jgi:hypothetical protein
VPEEGDGVALDKLMPPERTKILLAEYQEICKSHAGITDFRAKLLALLPIASGTGIGLLVTQTDGQGELSAWFLIALGAFGALVTIGLFFYEFHQMDDCQQLRNRGAWIEKQLGLGAGHFGSKRGKLGLRDIWPSQYRRRDELLSKRELQVQDLPPAVPQQAAGERQHRPDVKVPERASGTLRDAELDGERVPGLVNVRNADYIVYGAVFGAWIFVLAWGINEFG